MGMRKGVCLVRSFGCGSTRCGFSLCSTSSGISADGIVISRVVCNGNERRGRFSWAGSSVDVRD